MRQARDCRGGRGAPAGTRLPCWVSAAQGQPKNSPPSTPSLRPFGAQKDLGRLLSRGTTQSRTLSLGPVFWEGCAFSAVETAPSLMTNIS